MYEAEYADFGNNMPLNSMYSCMVLLLTCLGGMRGFEAVYTDLPALRYDLAYCKHMDREGTHKSLGYGGLSYGGMANCRVFQSS